MSQLNGLINFDGQTLFKVLDTTNYTIPDSVASPSPTGRSSGVAPVTTFDAVRASVGGQIICGFSDTAGNAVTNLQCKLNPGDVVAVGAIGGGVSIVTVNGVAIGTVVGVGHCGVIGSWA